MNEIVYAGRQLPTKLASHHTHNDWELIYTTAGSGVLESDYCDIKYNESDIVIVPPLLPHTHRSAEGLMNIHMNVAECSFSYT